MCKTTRFCCALSGVNSYCLPGISSGSHDLINFTMTKTLALICVVPFLAGFPTGKNSPRLHYRSSDSAKAVIFKISPAKPLIEKDIYGYYLNFDIAVTNQTANTLQLSSIEISVMDLSGKLVTRKNLTRTGQAPGIEVLGNTVIKPGETINIFNPFHTFTPDISIATLKYGFFFDYSDTPQQMDYNKKRLPVDYDVAIVKTIKPQVYVARNEYFLPLKGKIIVWGGHDFYSQNRRFSTSAADEDAKGSKVNSNRYAYDLMSIDGNGNMYHLSPFKKQNWYVFGRPVYSPADGKVVETENTIPDNEYNGKVVKNPTMPSGTDPLGLGNHVVIDHGDGEYSVLLYLEKGSVRVRPGETIKRGDLIGNVGFSGNATYPHLHYGVMNNAKNLVGEGIPSYFNDYKLYRGAVILPVKRSRIDSGDIVESDK